MNDLIIEVLLLGPIFVLCRLLALSAGTKRLSMRQKRKQANRFDKSADHTQRGANKAHSFLNNIPYTLLIANNSIPFHRPSGPRKLKKKKHDADNKCFIRYEKQTKTHIDEHVMPYEKTRPLGALSSNMLDDVDVLWNK